MMASNDCFSRKDIEMTETFVDGIQLHMAEQVILEWNAGGHFADSGKRLAKGIRWLLMNNDERR